MHRITNPDRKVGHAVDEDLSGFTPTQRLEQRVGMQRDAEPGPRRQKVPVALVFRLAHRLEPTGQREGVAVIATG
jgi:hypothetical protein